MIRLLPYCLPVIRRVSRPFRRVSRPVGVATVAKVASVPVAVGLVCFMVPLWGGAGPRVAPGLPGSEAPALPVLPAGSVFGDHGGSIYGVADAREFAAVLPVPGASIFPPGAPYTVITPPTTTPETPQVSVPEPSSLAILAGAVVLLAGVRRFA